MDCSSFKRKHDAFIDDTLSGVEMSAMREHLAECQTCARTHHDLQRALLVARNLPRIEVSEGFQVRLQARLERERIAMATPRSVATRRVPAPARGTSTARGVAAAAALFAVGIMGYRLVPDDDGPPRLDAVVASNPPAPTIAGEDPAPAFVASMSTGIPMWPALMLAEEGPLRFVAMEQDQNEPRPR